MRAGEDVANGVGQDVVGSWIHARVDSRGGSRRIAVAPILYRRPPRVDTIMTMPRGGHKQVRGSRPRFTAASFSLTATG